jgi:hypothetical protein
MQQKWSWDRQRQREQDIKLRTQGTVISNNTGTEKCGFFFY